MEGITPLQQALDLYAAHPEMNMMDDLTSHIAFGGHVFATPSCIAMVRPVRKDWEPKYLADLSCIQEAETADCWFIWLAAGDLAAAAEALLSLAGPQKWLAFQRDGPPHFWRFQSVITWLKARAAAQTAKQSTSSAKA